MRAVAARIAMVALAVAACGPAFTAAGGGNAFPAAVGQLIVVAHEDDDLLFINPDFTATLRDGSPLVIVYLTAGDDGNTTGDYYSERERGVEAAYADLAQVTEPEWSDAPLVVHGHTLARRTLKGASVDLVFVRLPDGGGDGLGFSKGLGRGASLAKLWNAHAPTLTSVDGRETYDRADLIATLSELMAQARPARVDTLESTDAHGFDHSDHRYAGLFTQAASPAGTDLNFYRGYNIRSEPTNIATEEVDAKWAAFLKYAAHDMAICPKGQCDSKLLAGYHDYALRVYPISSGLATSGPIANGVGSCLEATSAGVRAAVCDDASDAQRFTFTPAAELVAAGGACLRAQTPGPALATCGGGTGPEAQRWSLLSSGSLMAAHGTCLRGPDQGVGPIVLGACAAVPAAQWVVRFAAERVWQDAPDTTEPDAFMFGDIDRDRHVDACARLTDGIWCALGDGTSFGEMVARGHAFADVDGWGDPRFSATVRMVDIDHDGRSDFCGWRGQGIECAITAADGTIGANHRVSHGVDFFQSDVASLAFADVSGDNMADACAHVGQTIRCALGNAAGTLDAATTWLQGPMAFRQAVGGPRLAFADVTGDGRADVCRVDGERITCASAHRQGPGFIHPRQWCPHAPALPGQDAAAVFADIDGDGEADVCVPSDAGLACARSTGSGFTAFLVRVPRYPEDAPWGAELALVDANGDGHADACRWGASGVRCAMAP